MDIMSLLGRKTRLVTPDEALPGRLTRPFTVTNSHTVLDGHQLEPPFPSGLEVAYVAMGCFWGAERIFWQTPGVWSTSVGYMGGYTPNPTYEEVCSEHTGHAEAVRIVFDPLKVSFEQILKEFWENHDPTQGMRQGNDVGTQYRSAVYPTSPEQAAAVSTTATAFGEVLAAGGAGEIRTDIRPAADAGTFWLAEDHHQQYLDKNPRGYCNHGPNGFSCPIGVAKLEA